MGGLLGSKLEGVIGVFSLVCAYVFLCFIRIQLMGGLNLLFLFVSWFVCFELDCSKYSYPMVGFVGRIYYVWGDYVPPFFEGGVGLSTG